MLSATAGDVLPTRGTSSHLVPSAATARCLADLPSYEAGIPANASGEMVRQLLVDQPQLPGIVLLEGEQVLGMLSRDKLFRWLAKTYGQALFARRPASDLWASMVEADSPGDELAHFLTLAPECSIPEAVDRALGRSPDFAYEPILVTGTGQPRLVNVHDVLCAHSRLYSDANVELQQARSRAEEATREKANILATISHDMRTPLNGVIGMAQDLKNTGLEAEQREFLDIIDQASTHLMDIIDDILDCSSWASRRADLEEVELGNVELENVELEEVDYSPQQALHDVVMLFRARAAEKNVTLAYECEAGVPATVVGDAGRLREVVNNLVSNACKFTECGSVTVRLGVVPRRGTERLRVEVEDTGIGFDADATDHMFERSVPAVSSTTSKYGGNGRGLSICQVLVELMGGELEVQSQPGVGSCFWFELPMREASSEVCIPYATTSCTVSAREREPMSASDYATNEHLHAHCFGNAPLYRPGAQLLNSVPVSP